MNYFNSISKSILTSGQFKTVLFMLTVLCAISAKSQDKPIVHDPVMIKQDSMYYLFCTGWGISMWSSADMADWKKEKPVFDKPPAWTIESVPGFKGHIWAPDISFHDNRYYLYYSVSAFGKNTSCIGVATNTTLNPNDPAYHWEDHGKVVQSVPGRDMWNAIDPNLTMDENNDAWLTFGSFWDGIKQVKLTDSLDVISEPESWYTVARRMRDFKYDDIEAGNAAIEAPFIFKKNHYYYLFVSFDYCCRGINSTYKIMVGRSEKINGPYIDRDGVEMNQGGGTLVVGGNESWPGVGHNSTYTFDGIDYIIFHGYDASDNGKPKLLIRKITWDEEGWPIVNL